MNDTTQAEPVPTCDVADTRHVITSHEHVTWPHERIDPVALMQAIRVDVSSGEFVVCRQPFRWHDPSGVIPNASECFSLEDLADEHGWLVVAQYGEHIAVVKRKPWLDAS